MPRADVVLVFPFKTESQVCVLDDGEEPVQLLRPPTNAEKHQMEAWQIKRLCALMALRETGLRVVPFYSRDRNVIFVKVTADEQHLREVAEEQQHRLQLREQYLSAFAAYKSDYAGRRDLNYRDRCVVSHLYQPCKVPADGSDGQPSQPSLFRTVDRIQLVDCIVRSQGHRCAGLDISQLLHSGDLLHYFPAHERWKLLSLERDWVLAFALGTHADSVRDYFGECVAMRFLFRAHLHAWLALLAAAGLVLWLAGAQRGAPGSAAPLLPCLGTSLWAALFTHSWRRTAAWRALHWGSLGGAAARPAALREEAARPAFLGVRRLRPASGRVERHYPWRQRIRRVAFSGGVLAAALAAGCLVAALLLALRRGLAESVGEKPCRLAAALVVEVLNGVLVGLARGLTDRENHRTDSEYAAHLLAKTVVFKFFNCYALLYYIAFFKEHADLFGMPTRCVDDDCLSDLGSQLTVFFAMRVALQGLFEFLVPCAVMWVRGSTEGHALAPSPDTSSAERESMLEQYDMHEDMDDTLILFGYTAFFVVACPWAPWLALLSSLLGCFFDQKRLLLLCQRPFPGPAADNEPWETAFDIFACIAVVTNIALAIFSSHGLDSWRNYARILLFVLVEHTVICARILIGILWPALPSRVQTVRLQQQAVIHRHFDLGGEEASNEVQSDAAAPEEQPLPQIFDTDEDGDATEWN